MDNHLITNSPNITGNIGSCETKVVQATESRISFWKINSVEIATNSCTGQIEKFQHYEYTPSAFFVFGALFCFSLLFYMCGLKRNNRSSLE